jgi:uncharacterized protein (TIGR02145 family)
MNIFDVTKFGRTLLLVSVFVAMSVGTAAAQEKGAVTDSRDGRTYKTVKIGKQTWMAENIKYKTESGSWCYDNNNKNTDNCATYGRLYTWNAAKTACPKGWHLPSRKEWDALSDLAATRPKKLDWISGGDKGYYWPGAGSALTKSVRYYVEGVWYIHGNGSDKFGFSALLGGYRDSSGGFAHVRDIGNWWTATERDSGEAYVRVIYSDFDFEGVFEYGNNKGYGYSVRCIAD